MQAKTNLWYAHKKNNSFGCSVGSKVMHLRIQFNFLTHQPKLKGAEKVNPQNLLKWTTSYAGKSSNMIGFHCFDYVMFIYCIHC